MKKNSAQNFGKNGIFVILMSFFCYWIGTCFGGAGMSNTVIPALAEMRNFNAATMTSWCSLAGWISIPFVVIWAKLGERRGPKAVIVITLIIAAITIFLLGTATSLALWILALVISSCLASGYLYYAAPGLIANWFPTKKGLALGWASMGIICCDLLWTPYIVRAFTAFGVVLTFLAIGIAVLAIACIVLIFVKNTPEEKGCYPDNNPTPDEHRALMAQVTKQYKSDWSVVRLFKRRETWLVGIAGGMLWMGSSGPIISFFPRMTALNYDPNFISLVFQIAAIFSLFGSWLYGYIDTKIGTKKTMLIFCVVDFVCVLLMFLLAPVSRVGLVIAFIGLEACVGGIPNLIASMQTTIWGRWDYAACSKVITPIVLLILNLVFILTSFSVTTFGNWNFVYIVMLIFIVIGCILVSRIRDVMIGKTDEEILALYQAGRPSESP